MKKLIQLIFLVVLTAFFATETTYAQERGNDGNRASPNASVSQTIGTTVVSVTYGRPGLKGRELTNLVNDEANGEVWRTGANESTAITFSDDVMVGDEKVDAGTYSIYTIPGENEWTVILNNKLSWGTQYDMNEDYVRVSVSEVNNDAPNMEWFTIYFDSLSDTKAHLNLHWGTTMVAVPISTE